MLLGLFYNHNATSAQKVSCSRIAENFSGPLPKDDFTIFKESKKVNLKIVDIIHIKCKNLGFSVGLKALLVFNVYKQA